jgi:thiamine kinase
LIISDGDQRHVLRQPHDPVCRLLLFSPSVSRSADCLRLAPAPLFYSPCWMVVEYCAGEVKSELPAAAAVRLIV